MQKLQGREDKHRSHTYANENLPGQHFTVGDSVIQLANTIITASSL